MVGRAHAIGSKVPMLTMARLHTAAVYHMARIEADPDRVNSSPAPSTCASC
jgi:hypothetical protein